MKLDNFSFSGHQRCPLWYKTRILEGWTTAYKSAALGFGGAVHEGLATWYRHRDPDLVIASIDKHFPPDQPIDDFRDMHKCKKVLLEYMNNYTRESFTVIPGMVEVPASLPTWQYLPRCWRPRLLDAEGKPVRNEQGLITNWMGCGFDNRVSIDWDRFNGRCENCQAELELIEYGGIFDTLVEFQGQVYILEHKTTTQMGSRFFDQFKPNNQVTGYVWLGKGMSGRCDGSLINAIGLYKSQATRFERHISTRNQADLDAWLLDLWTEATLIREHDIFGHWPIRSQACTLYGACEFHQVHILSDKSVQQRLLEQDYVKSTWEFEKRDLRPT